MENIIITAISSISTLLLGGMLHYREMKKLTFEKDKEIESHIQEKEEHKIKSDVLDKLLDFTAFNKIKSSVDEIFKNTRADRFLILIAINGKTSFNVVSVIFEQHKRSKYQINAIARYKTLGIDTPYKQLLKLAEIEGTVMVFTERMEESLLKDLYIMENIVESHIRHLMRIHTDTHNDILVFSSLATHDKRGFTTIGKRKADLIYNADIKPTLFDVLKK